MEGALKAKTWKTMTPSQNTGFKARMNGYEQVKEGFICHIKTLGITLELWEVTEGP